MFAHGRAMGRGVAAPAFLGLALLALAALPFAAADPGARPLDSTGPTVRSISVDPNPVVPDLVAVRATATDLESNITFAEVWIDAPRGDGTSFFRMRPADGAFNSPTEDLVWLGPYFTFTQGIAPGLHRLNLHAVDLAGNWGPYASFAIIVADPSNTGPTVASLTATPSDLPVGIDLALEATAFDPFNGAVVASEFFFDRMGPDGTGTPLAPFDGSWGDPMEVVQGGGTVSLPPGRHAVYAHGLNDRSIWGTPASATFTIRAPVLSLELRVDPTEAGPAEVVTHSVTVANHGNADATEAWIDVLLPPTLVYLDDTAAAAGGTLIGPERWRFTDVSVGLAFTIRSQVRADATDGVDLAGAATLDYTNAQGWDFAAVTTTAVGVVSAPELRLTVTAPAVAFAAETFDLLIDLEHTGIRDIPDVEVEVDLGLGAVPIADNAPSLGGLYLGGGHWGFHHLAPGNHRLVVTEGVAAESADLAVVSMGVTARYLSRSGAPVVLREIPSIGFARPVLEVTAEVDRSEALVGDPITLLVSYANRGSATARDVEIAATLPDGVKLVGGDAPASSSGSRHVWRFSDIAAGESGRVTLVVGGKQEMAAGVWVELTYTSPNGAFLARRVASATVAFLPVPLPTPPPMAAIALAGTSVLLVALVATERGKTALVFTLFLPMYTRLRHEKVLDHETRGMIRGYIVANPGDHYNSIKEALELPNGTLAYHIQVLQKEMIVRSVKDGKFRRFYPAEMRIPEGGEPTKIQRVILDLIRTNPGITPRDAAGLLGLTASTVSYHLEKLVEHERIEYRREGITKRLYVQGDLDEP